MTPTLNLGVSDDRADLFERLSSGPLYPLVGVSQDLDQLGHDAGQTGGELLRSAERHRAQQLHRTWRMYTQTDGK